MNRKNLMSKKIGIIGGGQLGKMMVLEASKMGIKTIILDPSKNCPAGYLAGEHIIGDFNDKLALLELGEKSDVLTYEFEHISTEVLKGLEGQGYIIYPSVKSLEIIKNKFNQKMELKKNKIPLGKFLKVDSIEDIKRAVKAFGYPLMLKSSLGGYDGKGNSLIKCEKDIKKTYLTLNGGSSPIYAEKYIPFLKEISVLICRGINGEIKVYPVAENIHEDSILIESLVPAGITSEEKSIAIDIGRKVSEIFKGVGMFCIEMFLTKTGDLLVNEVAPRPHNSGHYTIEGCVTSQFENHIRAVVGLPLGETQLIRPTVMKNILGEKGYTGRPRIVGGYEALKLEGVKIHIYGKDKTYPQRKMGHITVTAPTLRGAKELADRASSLIKVVSKSPVKEKV